MVSAIERCQKLLLESKNFVLEGWTFCLVNAHAIKESAQCPMSPPPQTLAQSGKFYIHRKVVFTVFTIGARISP